MSATTALDEAAAKEVDAKIADLQVAYAHAQRVATKSWAGDRTFCEDAVRQVVGFMGIDGMMDAKERARWKKADVAKVKAEHLGAILERHKMMFGKDEPDVCAATLARYVEGLRYAATEGLQVRNFGY